MPNLSPRPDEDEQIQQLLGLDVLYLLLVSMIGLSLSLYNQNRQLKSRGQTKPCPICQEVRQFDKPPLISLTEAEGYTFPSGKAVISPEFFNKIRKVIVHEIIKSASEYQLDLVEVVGHTDEVPVKWNQVSNLDATLVPMFHGKFPVANLSADDNIGLAMMRAVVIADILRNDTRILAAKLIVVPLSAGQLILPDGTITPGRASDDSSRRRIDIRLRKLEESVAPRPSSPPKLKDVND